MIVKIKIGKEEACVDGRFVKFYRRKRFLWGLKYRDEASAKKAFKWFRRGGNEARNEIKRRIKFQEEVNR